MTTIANRHFGSDRISLFFNDQDRGRLRLAFTANYTSVPDKVRIGGFPVSMGKIGDYYIPILYKDTTTTFDDADDFFLYGNKMYYVYNSTSGTKVLPVSSVSGGDETPTEYSMINGVPFGFNTNRQLIAAEITGTPTQQDDLRWNGAPLRCSLINNNWYLNVKEY